MRFPTLLLVEGKPIYRQDLHYLGNAAGCVSLVLLALLIRLKVTKTVAFPDWQKVS
jgi:hypothetical protein